MKKGMYVVGDISQMFNKNSWERIREDFYYYKGSFNLSRLGEEQINGWCYTTNSSGYGNYDFTISDRSRIKHDYFPSFKIQSGLIGILPFEFFRTGLENPYIEEIINRNESLMVVEFERDFDVCYDCGTFKLGGLNIYTGNNDD